MKNAAKNALLPLDNQLCFALYSTSLTMSKVYKPLLAKLGVTYPQYLVLLVLWTDDGRSVSELGERLYLDSGTLTPLLKRLEAQGLVRRERDAEDERRVIVSLTAAGRKLSARADAVQEQVGCATGCSIAELGALTRQLATLRAALSGSLKS